MQEHGINLIEKAFEQVTDQQIQVYQLKTGKQRMDSTQIASNIREMSRLQLLVEVIQRVQRMVTEADQKEYAEAFAPFILGHSGQYVYHLKGQDTSAHIQTIGELMQRLLAELQSKYGQEPVYQMLKRVFGEHYRVDEKVVKTKLTKELSASSLQSPDDVEATYREKGHQSYKGYVANLSETCDPENRLQLITKAEVAPNSVDDAKLLEADLPNLKERTDLKTLYTDGSYGSPDADKTLRDHQVEQIQTAIRGRVPSSEKFNLADFEIKQTETGKPTQITCPQGQTVAVQSSSQKKGCVVHFDLAQCQACPFYQKSCPAQPGKRDPRLHLNFSEPQANVSQRRRRSLACLTEGRNLRAAIEATVREVKNPFPGSKLPVRGQFRVKCMIIGSALATNAHRIQRYLVAKIKLENEQKKAQKGLEPSQELDSVAFFAALKAVFETGLTLLGFQKQYLGC
jgi:hypothetical protein